MNENTTQAGMCTWNDIYCKYWNGVCTKPGWYPCAIQLERAVEKNADPGVFSAGQRFN